MLVRLRRRIGSAHVLALLALFVALGGGAYAAMKLPKNSVGTRQLKRGAVTPPKLSPAAVKALKGDRGPAGAKGAKGATGPKGAKGDAGPVGPAGPSDVYAAGASSGPIGGSFGQVASVSVPAGEYLLGAKVTIGSTTEGAAATVLCQIAKTTSGGTGITWDQAAVTAPAVAGQFTSEALSLSGAEKFTSSQAVVLSCQTAFGSASYDDARVWAIKAGAVHGLPLPID
jgi:hypothetical protein